MAPHRQDTWPRALGARRFAGLAMTAALTLLVAQPARATPQGDAALRLPVPPGKALVYLFRPSRFGPSLPIAVEANGRPIGSTQPQSCIVIEAPPAPLRLVSRGENTAELRLSVQAGRRYFVLQEASVGVRSVVTALRQVTRDQGHDGVEVAQTVRRIVL